jgi:peptidoglycan-associated lipoprotein
MKFVPNVLKHSAYLALIGLLAACARSAQPMMEGDYVTPTVDYVEALDVYSAPHKDSFLNQLAMNYRSYAIYNARTSGYLDIGELFANKAVAAFSGEAPFPESLENWPVENEQEAFDLHNAYNELMEFLKNDAAQTSPDLTAELQAKFDCWLSASASGQYETAAQCRDRFTKAMDVLKNCGNAMILNGETVVTEESTCFAKTKNVSELTKQEKTDVAQVYYPDTHSMNAVRSTTRPREGVIVVNNVNVPQHLINPEPVRPLVFNQNIFGGNKTVADSNNVSVQGCEHGEAECAAQPVEQVAPSFVVAVTEKDQPVQEEIPMLGEEFVSRAEFIDMMMAMRAELQAINERLDKLQATAGEKTMIKVQQIPLEPTQHIMEEVFEVRFDFNKATIKPEYQELIKKLASATQENKNIKVSVVGHTDTAGTKNYNYALGGRRAEAVQKMLIKYGIPASQIVAVSAGEEDLAVPTPDNTPNAANRRVRVVKEIHYTEEPKLVPMAIEVEEYSVESCGEYGCEQ